MVFLKRILLLLPLAYKPFSLMVKATSMFLILYSIICISITYTGCGNGKGILHVNTGPQFRITRDTVYVSIEGRLYHALLINGKYYTFYEVRDPMSSLAIRKFYILEKNGKVEKEIKVPKEILEDNYPKLYYWHNQIIVNTEFDPKTFFLDTAKNEFIQNAQTVNMPFLEDKNWEITADCHGEFGSTIYFKNKQSGETSTSNAGCPVIVNKLGDYFFANISGNPIDAIVEIPSPTTANSDAMSETIFESGLMSNFYIATSFVNKGVLCHIYNYYHDEIRLGEKKERIVITEDSVKIGIINNGIFKPICTLKDRCHIEFEQRLSSDYQICLFHTEDRIQIGFKKDIPPYMEAKYGVIEIKGDEIKIHYFFSKKMNDRFSSPEFVIPISKQ